MSNTLIVKTGNLTPGCITPAARERCYSNRSILEQGRRLPQRLIKLRADRTIFMRHQIGLKLGEIAVLTLSARPFIQFLEVCEQVARFFCYKREQLFTMKLNWTTFKFTKLHKLINISSPNMLDFFNQDPWISLCEKSRKKSKLNKTKQKNKIPESLVGSFH